MDETRRWKAAFTWAKVRETASYDTENDTERERVITTYTIHYILGAENVAPATLGRLRTKVDP
jgi:hypothetical protein